jgi:Uma2 family endonuclease
MGDRLTREEFERRYSAMPHLKKAELIGGVVYMPSPAKMDDHGSPTAWLVAMTAVYEASTPGVQAGDNATVRLDLDNEPQPDALLRIRPEFGGQSDTVDGYVAGAPEWIGEVSASTVSYDLHDKLHVYRRHGVREYVVWRVWDREIDWFVLRQGNFDRKPLDSAGLYKSDVFPGLWLDPAALIRGELAHALKVLQQGLATPDHAAFIEQLQQKRPTT